MTKLLSVQLPFSGFYESIWSRAIDSEEESFCEYQDQDGWQSFPDIAALPKEMRPDIGWPGLAEILYNNSRYSIAYANLAKDYAANFWDVISGELGIPVQHEWDGMSSPREYNFTTDRIFSKVPLKVMRLMLNALLADAESRHVLESMITRNHSSRSGFISFYSNNVGEWLAKPLGQWDHNELATLLEAYIKLTGICEDSDSIDWHIYDTYNMHESAYSAWDSCVDWPAVESALQDIAVECGELDPAKLPYRCPFTLELPLAVIAQQESAH